MKTIRLVITSAFMLLLCLTAKAQWAGEDKEVLREPDNSQTVTIGTPDGSSDKCYDWSGPNIVSDPHQATITVNPQSSEEFYTVTRTSSCGVEQDQVKVKLIDTITIVSVTPLKNCYNHGDEIPKTDFEIVTSPPGYESLVQYSPHTAYNAFEAFGTGCTQTVTFTLEYNGHVSTETTTVSVYNDNLTSTTVSSVNLANFMKQLGKVKYMVDKAQKVTDFINKFAKPGVSPCQPQFNANVDFPHAEVIHTCCEGEEVIGFVIHSSAYSVELGVSCDIPTTISIPGVGGLFIHVGGGIGASVGPFDFKYKGKCNEASVPVAIYVFLEGGVTVMVKDPDLFKAELKLVGKAQTSWTWTIGEEIKWQPLAVTVSIVGTASFFSQYSKTINYVLFTETFFN